MMLRRITVILSCVFIFSASLADEIQIANLDKKFILPPSANEISSVFNKLEKRLRDYPEDHEAELLKAILYFKSGKLELALNELDELIKKVPDFQLAHLLKGDLLLSRFGETNNLGQTTLLASLIPALDNDKKQHLNLLREEARLRLQALLKDKKTQALPRQILALGESVDKALLVDKKSNRIYLFARDSQGQSLRKVKDYYVSTGKLVGDKSSTGDLRTPEGVYFVTSWISPDKLPEKYGIGAFPVNYPNELDKRNGKTGYGIWLHGTDKGYYSRPPRDSEGCVVLTNVDLEALKSEISPGITPVVITESAEWIDYETWNKERQDIFQAIENWRRDWESMDVNKYLSHYSKDFWSATHNFKSWAARKRNIANSKKFQKIELSDVSLLAYPQKKNAGKQLVVVRLHQNYISNNFKSDMNKRLYLTRQNDAWKIMYEGK